MKVSKSLPVVVCGALLLCGISGAWATQTAPSQDTSAKQDMKNAGHATKTAAKDAGQGTKKGTAKAYNKTKSGTKKAVNKTKSTTKGAVEGAQEGAKQPQ